MAKSLPQIVPAVGRCWRSLLIWSPLGRQTLKSRI